MYVCACVCVCVHDVCALCALCVGLVLCVCSREGVVWFLFPRGGRGDTNNLTPEETDN